MVTDKYYFQCQVCGNIHCVETQFNIEDDLFIELKCGHCRDDTKHIWVGDSEADVYIYGNLNLDSRYYNTK